MPEGHSVHRITRQFQEHFVGRLISASSPQGRFSSGASIIDGTEMIDAFAVGKHMFLGFETEHWLRVHLGIYGAWDFTGEVTVDATVASAAGRMGQTNQRGTVPDSAGEDSLRSIGAPRRTRLRMAESERVDEEITEFPPPPIGQVRVRLLTDASCADLRGPTACEVLERPGVDAVLARLGPDPLVSDPVEGEQRFVDAVRRRATPIGLLLMDQSVVSGIGNVYRAELLFRAGLDPHTPGRLVPEELVRELWRDWSRLLEIGVTLGQMMTMDDLDDEAWRLAMGNRDDRHWVYHREGQPCRRCGTNVVMEMAAGRKLYWCPGCQR